MQLLIATHNKGKVREYVELLAGLDLALLSLDDVGINVDLPEDGATYLENAVIKARGYAALAGLLTLADDSGLEVDALAGAPGIYSARFGGFTSDAERCELLLKQLDGIAQPERTARFRCVIALCWPDGREAWTEGVCNGRITTEPRGTNGFGYDPIFWVEQAGKTMAELPASVKNRISHRAMAAHKARELLAPLARP